MPRHVAEAVTSEARNCLCNLSSTKRRTPEITRYIFSVPPIPFVVLLTSPTIAWSRRKIENFQASQHSYGASGRRAATNRA